MRLGQVRQVRLKSRRGGTRVIISRFWQVTVTVVSQGGISPVSGGPKAATARQSH